MVSKQDKSTVAMIAENLFTIRRTSLTFNRRFTSRMITLVTWRATLLARSSDLFCALVLINLAAEWRILMKNAG